VGPASQAFDLQEKGEIVKNTGFSFVDSFGNQMVEFHMDDFKQIVLVPKDEGQGVMVSAFQSREFGFGFVMSPEQLQQVNNARRGKKYKDEEAAISRLGTAYKKDLLKSPFIKEFEYGASNEGYWCYDHMVLHFEDVVDCLITLYPQYDYLFLFDHSCGHDKQREDGLNVQKMSKLYGGKQPIMRNTVLTKEEGFLGPYR